MLRRLLVVGLIGGGLLALGGYFGYEAGVAYEGERGYGFWPFLGVAFLFKFLLIGLLVLFISKLFFFRRWRAYGGSHGGPGPRHWGDWRGHHDYGHHEGRRRRGEPEDDDPPEVA